MTTETRYGQVMDVYSLGTVGRFELIYDNTAPEHERWCVKSSDGVYSFHNAQREGTLDSLGKWFLKRLGRDIEKYTEAVTEDEMARVRDAESNLQVLIDRGVSLAEALDAGFREFNPALLNLSKRPLEIDSDYPLGRYKQGDPFVHEGDAFPVTLMDLRNVN